MIEMLSSARCRAVVTVASIAIAAPVHAQQTSVTRADSLGRAAQVLPLSLGDAARLAARQSAIAQGARLRADEAQARVRERRADLLPNITSYANQSGHTLNSATFGISFPAPPGEKPFFDPAGEVIGPINLVDVRGRVQQSLLDFAAVGRVRQAQAQARSSNADADFTAEQAATVASNAYVGAMRADAE